MPRKPTAHVQHELLESIFDEFELWEKIADGRLLSEVVALDPSRAWPGATSRIIKHYLPSGKHIATTHLITDARGTVLHRHAKDFLMYEVCLWE
ncbi:MAG: hypothetical protein HY681_01905 [Chloroflexi bacterium]|nr:hypothetical protein [Chloroflexota bacterium]